MTNWSPQQADALARVARWHRQCMDDIANGEPPVQQVFRVFGYAGTGKTTLARHFADTIDGDTCYAAFTGKAAMVMRKSGCENASTIHGLIYDTRTDPVTGEAKFEWDADGAASDAALICIDECSMVNDELGKDLLRYGRPILVLGDPAQLPPVKSKREAANGTGAGYFTDAEPDVMLTEIHRQAEDNPIIHLATLVREGRSLKHGIFGTSKVIHMNDVETDAVTNAEQVLVGLNKSRSAYNRRLRSLSGLEGAYPVDGDRLVCLKNNRDLGIFNGGMFTCTGTATVTPDGESASMNVRSEDMDDAPIIPISCRIECWTGGLASLDWRDKRGFDEFDYGYALTVHKSQGSQWRDVYLFDESAAFRADNRRWLYTGITRAAETITIVTGG